jgi:dolichol-phosphate mannosyltransferase
MPTSDCFVSVVAPLDNDGDIVQSFIEDVLTVLKQEYDNYELVLIDDGSKDDTVEKVSQLLKRHECIRLIRLSRRFGQEIAISAGLDSVIGDFTVIMLPDSDPPNLIPGMVEKSRRNVGVVFGIDKHRGGEPLYIRLGARLFYWYFNHVLKIELPPNTRDFRVYSREVVNAITRIKDHLRYHRVFSGFVGYGMESFEYDQAQRRRKPRVKSFSQAVRIAIEMIIANSTHPLRTVSFMGLGLAILSFIHMVYVTLVYLLDEKVVAGWATRSLHTSLMFMFLFLILAALCEYIGRLIEEVKDRPQYYVMEERNSSVLLADEERKNVVTEAVQQ